MVLALYRGLWVIGKCDPVPGDSHVASRIRNEILFTLLIGRHRSIVATREGQDPPLRCYVVTVSHSPGASPLRPAGGGPPPLKGRLPCRYLVPFNHGIAPQAFPTVTTPVCATSRNDSLSVGRRGKRSSKSTNCQWQLNIKMPLSPTKAGWWTK